MSREELARRQAALVAALVLGESVPEGFDPDRVRATTEALLRKRAGEVGAQWPALRTQLGPQWSARFTAWAAGRAMEALLAGVRPSDLPTYATAVGLVVLMTLTGSLLPALRAVRVDPTTALRT